MSTSVEWLILADSAQVVGGKLYLLGGGWDLLTVNQPFPVTRRSGLAASFRVPWTDTNFRHNVNITISDADGQELAKIDGVRGRPPTRIPVGSDQRAKSRPTWRSRSRSRGSLLSLPSWRASRRRALSSALWEVGRFKRHHTQVGRSVMGSCRTAESASDRA
jgi:hypothetical protein